MTTNTIGFVRLCALIAAAAVVPALGLGLAPAAGAQVTDFGPCGNPADKHVALWNDVKHASPQHKDGAIDVVWPAGDKSRGYAVRQGHHPAQLTDLLVIPTARETGIECANLLDANAPHYLKDAFEQVSILPPGNQGQAPDWALGINSADNRGQEQLHVHVTLLDPTARADIDQNFFAALNTDIVAPLKKAGTDVNMSNETLLITKNHQGPGFIVIASDEKSGLAPFGVNNIERLLDKG